MSCSSEEKLELFSTSRFMARLRAVSHFPSTSQKSSKWKKKCIASERTMANSLFIRGVNHRMNVCRVHLKGMEVAFTVCYCCCSLTPSTLQQQQPAINWKSHVFIHCPLCTTIFLSTIYLFIHSFSCCLRWLFCLLRFYWQFCNLIRLHTRFHRLNVEQDENGGLF